jgi:DNA-binding MarR family transcriptional regulator
MNYSDVEISTSRRDDDALVEAGVQLLPVISRALFSAISGLGNAYGLTPAQVKVLLHLGTHRQMTVGEIAAALPCSMPSASELVDRLVDAGHLVRTSDPADRRRVLVAATPDSEKISSRLREMREAQVRYALDQLAPEDRTAFIRSLEALIAGLTHAEGAPEMGCQYATPAHGIVPPPVENEKSTSATAGPIHQENPAAGETGLARSLQGTGR